MVYFLNSIHLDRFSVNRAVRPTSVSVRPTNFDGGTWVTVTQATAIVQPPPVPTLLKATTNSAVNTAVKSTTNLVLASGHKSAPVLTPAPSASSISIIGPPKVTVPTPASNITLFSVRGTSSQPSKSQKLVNTSIF